MKCILLNKKMLNNTTSASNITEKISLKFVKKNPASIMSCTRTYSRVEKMSMVPVIQIS